MSNTVRTEDPDPPGPHLLVLARRPRVIGGCRVSWRPHTTGREKGGTALRLRHPHRAAGGHWHIPTGCRKGHVRQALSTGGPEAAAEALPTWWTSSAETGSASNSPTMVIPLDDEHNAALAALARRFGLTVVATTAAHFAEAGRPRLAMAMGRSRRASPWTRQRAAGPMAARICAPGTRWPGCSSGILKRSPPQPIWASGVRSDWR